MTDVTLIPGDGIGPEIVAAARRVLDAATSKIAWDVVEAGEVPYARSGQAVPETLVESLGRTRIGLKGPVTVPLQGYPSPNTEIRNRLGLWGNARFAKTMGPRPRFPDVDLVMIRDLSEDLNRGAQQSLNQDTGIGIKFITRAGATRIADFALGYATHRRKKVTVPNQAPTQRTTDGLFVDAVMAAAKRHPQVELRLEAMDSVAMHLATRPDEYDILLCMNTYGGILSGLCAGITGGVGLMPGFLTDGAGTMVFEAGHGSAPKYAGHNKVNPTGLILCGALLLDQIGERSAAAAVRRAVNEVVFESKSVTYDLGGTASTSEMTDAVLARLA